MRVCIILLFTVLQLSAENTYAQSVSLSFSLKNTTIERILDKIEEETEFTFLILDKSIALNKTIGYISVNKENIDQVLNKLLKDTDIKYRIIDRQIVLMPGSVASTLSATPRQEGHTVTGIAKDTKGETIIGASVREKGTTNGVFTDADGKFRLSVKDNAVLQVSFLGYITQEIDIKGKSDIEVVMQENQQSLDEVVVVGYGTQKKVNLTGAITNVKTNELTSIPASNLSNTLAGRAPGVTIVGNSGLTGSSSSIRMRGAFGEPLYVIDGVISTKRAFDALDATEVDQLSFLKDAATASIYGSSAGNGVVLVTTKKGNAGVSKPRFEYQGSYSFSNTTMPLFTDLFNATDELIYQNRVADFQGRSHPNGDKEFAYFENRDYNVNDWIWQNPWNMKHSFSVDGGTENLQYFVMANYQKEEGSYVSMSNDKYNIRSNVTAKLSKAISLNVNLSAYQIDDKRFNWFGSGDDDYAVVDMYRGTFNAMRTTPFYVYEDGTPAKVGDVTPYSIAPDFGSWKGWNPVDMVVGDRYTKTRRRNLNSTMSLNVNLGSVTEGLSTRVMFNYKGDDYSRKKFMNWQKNYYFQKADPDNRFVPGPVKLDQYENFIFGGEEYLSYQMQNLWSEQFNWFIDYNRKFDKHGVTATAVFEQATNGGDYASARAEKPITNIDQWYVFSRDRTNRDAGAEEYTGGRLSWIGRLNYNFDEKYIAEFSFRYDGNSLFAPGKRWGFFPSVSAAWRVNQEKFMESTKGWLSNLKLRASYGTTGNDYDVNNNRTAAFQYIAKYSNSSNSYIFGENKAPVITPSVMPNPDLTWATVTSYNAGLDFGFLDNKLTGTVDVFRTKETDILGPRTITLPGTYGTTLADENYAERSKKGYEITLNWQDYTANGNIRYSAYVNVGYAKDRWDVLDQSALYTTGNLSDISRIGRSAIGYQRGLIAIDLIRTQEQVDELKAAGFKQFGRDPYLGSILYKDTRGPGYSPGPDGVIDNNDTYNLLSDNATPRVNYGFGGDVEWKGISLATHFQGVGPYDKFVGGIDGGFNQYGGTNRVYFPIWASNDVWTPENVNGKYPRIVGSSYYESGAGTTSFWKRNGAYLRLKNLNVGYRLPKVVTNMLSIEAAQIYFNATNLFVLSELTEFHDPEQAYYDSYPLMKTFTFGLKFSF